MNKAEVTELLTRIKHRFPMFQIPQDFNQLKEMAVDWHESLQSLPYEVAKENLIRHAATEKYPPSIADLSRQLKDHSQKYHESMRATADEHIASLDHFEKTAVGPTEDQRRRVRESLARRPDRNATAAKH